MQYSPPAHPQHPFPPKQRCWRTEFNQLAGARLFGGSLWPVLRQRLHKMVLLVPSELNPPSLLGVGTSALPWQMGRMPEREGWNAHLGCTRLLPVQRTRAASPYLLCRCPSCPYMVLGSLLLPPAASQCQVSPRPTRLCLSPSLCPHLLAWASGGYNLSLSAGLSPTA